MDNLHTVTVETVDIEGKGVARIDGKAVFIAGALPGEIVSIEIYKRKPNFDLARLIEIIKPSPERVKPECPNFGLCGGCSLQHIDFETQVAYKQQVLIDNLKHIGKVSPSNVLAPLYGQAWGYRYRARLSARYVIKKERALVGFREKASSYVAEMSECRVLPKHISDLIMPLRELLNQLSIRERIPQIEVAVGDNVSVLVFRIMEDLSTNDKELIKQCIDKYSTETYPLQAWLQPKGPDSCYPFHPVDNALLSYGLPDFGITMPYYPTEFTQVNPIINQQMVAQALALLDLNVNETVADFFCGIGNFTLAIAKTVKQVTGIEGSEQLVKRAIDNAKYNQLLDKVNYIATNLFKVDENWLIELGKFDKWLIDPPRDGAIELIKAISMSIAPTKIIYVSCNPATLARDAAVLVNVHGYKLLDAGVMNMFPHTSHIESIAVFSK